MRRSRWTGSEARDAAGAAGHVNFGGIVKSSLDWEVGDTAYHVEYTVSGRFTKDTFEEQGETPEVEITRITFDGIEIPYKDWEDTGLDEEAITEKILVGYQDV